jgi:hypothetical protein
VRRNAARWNDVLAVARSGVNSPLTSSPGRLFDAAAAVLGVRDAINYEGQAAVELEQLADPGELAGYSAGISEGEQVQVLGADLIRAVVDDIRGGVSPAIAAARFHHGVADAIARTCAILRERTGLGVVALSGGVFQNLLLLDRTVSRLEGSGFRVLVHGRVPPNDGGISLGQAAVAAARDRLLLRVFVRGFQEFPGHYAHGYVTRLERVGRDGRRVDLDKGWELRLGPDDLPPFAEPTPDSDHASGLPAWGDLHLLRLATSRRRQPIWIDCRIRSLGPLAGAGLPGEARGSGASIEGPPRLRRNVRHCHFI